LSVSKLPRAESDNLADLGGGPKSRALNQATSGGSRIFGSRLGVARASPQGKVAGLQIRPPTGSRTSDFFEVQNSDRQGGAYVHPPTRSEYLLAEEKGG
jgi:hypothetical protein